MSVPEVVFTDRDGNDALARPDDWDLCLGCGAPSWHLLDGLPFHPEHWVQTTASDRERMWQWLQQWRQNNPDEYRARLARAAPPSDLRRSVASGPAEGSTRSVVASADTAAAASVPASTSSSTTPPAPAPVSSASPRASRERRGRSQVAASGSREAGGRGLATPAARSAAAPAVASSFRAVAAVVDVTTIWLPDGSSVPLEQPVRHLGDLEALGRSLNLGFPAVRWRTTPEAGQIVPTPALWRQLGVDVEAIPTRDDKRRAWLEELSQDLPALSDAAAEGWAFGDGRSAPQLRGITRLRRAGAERGQIAVLCLQAMDSTLPTGDATAVMSGATAPRNEHPSVTARRLQLFAEAVGIPFRGAIGTGMDLLELVTPLERKKQWETVDYSGVGPASIGMLDEVFNWTRRPDAGEQQLDYVHAFDRNGAYLAACSSVLLGLGRPQLYENGCAFDDRRAGWWLIDVPAHEEWRWPSVLDPAGRSAGTQQWVTTTTLAYAVKEEGFTPQVHRAWLWAPEQSSRLLEPWYRVLRDARNTLLDSDDPQAPVVLEMVKQIYKRTNGWFAAAAAKGTPAFQPYFHHAIRAASKVGMLHTVKAIGVQSDTWPVVVADTDVLAYASAQRDPVAGWPGRDEGKARLGSKLGRGLGGYKPYRSGSMTQQLSWLTGRGWGGREALQDVREWMNFTEDPLAEAGAEPGSGLETRIDDLDGRKANGEPVSTDALEAAPEDAPEDAREAATERPDAAGAGSDDDDETGPEQMTLLGAW